MLDDLIGGDEDGEDFDEHSVKVDPGLWVSRFFILLERNLPLAWGEVGINAAGIEDGGVGGDEEHRGGVKSLRKVSCV